MVVQLVYKVQLVYIQSACVHMSSMYHTYSIAHAHMHNLLAMCCPYLACLYIPKMFQFLHERIVLLERLDKLSHDITSVRLCNKKHHSFSDISLVMSVHKPNDVITIIHQ